MTKYIVYDEFRVNNGAQFFSFFCIHKIGMHGERTVDEQIGWKWN